MGEANGGEPREFEFCDLVMKGGITSGVVYPAALEILSHKYFFKNIGGTSAGAIAASVTAAAEYNRRQNGVRTGFDKLAGLSNDLQAKVNGKSRLLSLFQPDRSTARLFNVLLASLNRGGTYSRIFAVLGGLLSAYWPATLVAVVLGAIAYYFGGVLAGVLGLVVSLVVLIGVSVYRDVTRRMVVNGFGLCTGMGGTPEVPALTPWLHSLIQSAAGLPSETPLTFGDLWNAKGMPQQWREANPNLRSIDLQMFSTNLSQGRPYIFPLTPKGNSVGPCRADERLFFTVEELTRYLPGEVLDWMIRHGTKYRPDPNDEGCDPDQSDPNWTRMIELPEPRDFPVLLAARMSLSFPVLFAGVPLWAINYDTPRRTRRFRRCWFSDGGICSNFPMHLFDGLLPSWPTFGIDLEPDLGRDDVYLPTRYCEGYGERWNLFDEQTNSASRCGGFFIAMVNVMQNWNDSSLSRMPGVRDRIARVRLTSEEGGLNLNMPADAIRKVTDRGVKAINKLIGQFAPHGTPEEQAGGWDRQRWIRLCVLLRMVEERAPGVRLALSHDLEHATQYGALIERAGQVPPPGYDRVLTSDERQAMHDALGALNALVSPGRAATAFQAVPKPELRVRPPL